MRWNFASFAAVLVACGSPSRGHQFQRYEKAGSSERLSISCRPPAPSEAWQAPVHVYFGNMHSHTSFSDGSGTPEEAYRHAQTAGLDFLAVTEHNHKAAEGSGEDDGPVKVHIARDHELYEGPRADALIPAAGRINSEGHVVALYGQEFSSIGKGNHVNVFEVAKVIDEDDVANGDFKTLVRTWLPSHLDSEGKPALIQFNHPALFDDDTKEYGRDDFGGASPWVDAMDAHAQLIEILNGPALKDGTEHEPAEVMEADYLSYLNKGFHLAPTGDQDNHFRNWGDSTDARTAVLATAKTRAAILQALRERHVYATEDKNLRLIPRVNGQLVGTRFATLPTVGDELALSIEISDDDDDQASYRVDVFSDKSPGGQGAQVVETVFAAAAGTVQASGVNYTGPGQYVFFRVTQTDVEDEPSKRERAWTAPVWFEKTQQADTGLLMVHIDSILQNPVGNENENESATIHNAGTTSVSLVGWKLRDKANATWSLDSLGTLGPDQAKTILRKGQGMGMNNAGDEVIELVSPDEGVVDEIRYNSTVEGQAIPHPHQ